MVKPARANVQLSGFANVEVVHIEEGQTLTVWLDGIQIEMRVIKKGRIEIFCDTQFEPLPFDKWKPMEESI